MFKLMLLYDFHALPEYAEAAEEYEHAMRAVDTCRIGESREDRIGIREQLEAVFEGPLALCIKMEYQVSDGDLSDRDAMERARRAWAPIRERVRGIVDATPVPRS